MDVVMQILRYLKSVPGRGTLFPKHIDYQDIKVYIDAN